MTNFILSLCLISIFFGISSGFNKEATLKKSLLEYYDPTTKPEGQTAVEISVRPVNMKMCPHSQVLTSGQLFVYFRSKSKQTADFWSKSKQTAVC